MTSGDALGRSLSLPARTRTVIATLLVASFVVIPTTGFALQLLSTRTVFGLAMGLFCTGTLIAGVAPGFWVLLVARVVQASGPRS